MQKATPVLGWIGLAFGAVTAVCAMLPGWGAFIAMMTMLPGFLLSSVYILLCTRYQVTSPKWINPGYVGMLLSSVPLLMLIYFQLTK